MVKGRKGGKEIRTKQYSHHDLLARLNEKLS